MTPERLKQIREQLGLFQRELGEVVGRKKRMIVFYEKGKHQIPELMALFLEGLMVEVDRRKELVEEARLDIESIFPAQYSSITSYTQALNKSHRKFENLKKLLATELNKIKRTKMDSNTKN